MWELFCVKVYEKENIYNCEDVFVLSPDFSTAYIDVRRLNGIINQETQAYTMLEMSVAFNVLQEYPMRTRVIFHNGCIESLGEMLSGYCEYMSNYLRA